MEVSVSKHILKTEYFEVEAFFFMPDSPVDGLIALGTHGYTSCKNDLIGWASRLSDAGCPTIIFDLPGHFLGSFRDLNSLNDFTENAHTLFNEALILSGIIPRKVILMGHSLGAFFSLKAAKMLQERKFETLNICVGFGIHDEDKPNLLESALYKKTMDIRRQLVSTHLPPEKVLTWLKKQKNAFEISSCNICLISGENDIVVGRDGCEKLQDRLTELGNTVIMEKPKNLPHHAPELAASHIMSLLKKRYQIFDQPL